MGTKSNFYKTFSKEKKGHLFESIAYAYRHRPMSAAVDSEVIKKFLTLVMNDLCSKAEFDLKHSVQIINSFMDYDYNGHANWLNQLRSSGLSLTPEMIAEEFSALLESEDRAA